MPHPEEDYPRYPRWMCRSCGATFSPYETDPTAIYSCFCGNSDMVLEERPSLGPWQTLILLALLLVGTLLMCVYCRLPIV